MIFTNLMKVEDLLCETCVWNTEVCFTSECGCTLIKYIKYMVNTIHICILASYLLINLYSLT